MSKTIKNFCIYRNLNILDKLSSIEKEEAKKIILYIYKNSIKVKNIEILELLYTYFFKQKQNFNSEIWIKKSIIGKPGKDGTGYIVYKNNDPSKEYVMKEFKKKKSFDRIRNEVKFQTIASLHGISPKIYEYGKDPLPYIIMDKMNGGTIIDVIKRQKGMLTYDQQKQLINIYDTLNKIKINHNDSNLLNLMFNNGKLYIIDFGLANPLEKKDNFTSLKLSLSMMRGFQAYLSEPPELLLDYINDNNILKQYWLSKKIKKTL